MNFEHKENVIMLLEFVALFCTLLVQDGVGVGRGVQRNARDMVLNAGCA